MDWTKEKCQEEASKYKNKSQLQKNNDVAYNYAFLNNWLTEFYPTKWFVYLVESNDKEILYCGITTNIENRINVHNSGNGSKMLRGKRLPVICVYSKEYSNRSEASKEEYRIKQLNRKEKIKLINKLF